MKSPREFPNESTSTLSTSFPGFSPTHPTEPFVGRVGENPANEIATPCPQFLDRTQPLFLTPD